MDILILSHYPEEGISNLWNEFGANTVAVMAGKAMPDKVCGSSGASTTLLGCYGVLMCRDVTSAIADILTRSFADSSPIFCPSRENNWRTFESVTDRLLKTASRFVSSDMPFRLLNLYRIVKYCYSELSIIYPIEVWAKASSEPDFLDRAKSLFSTGHAAHVQGFLYGASFGLVFGVIMPAWKRRKII